MVGIQQEVDERFMPQNDDIPDFRDGLTKKERIVMYCLHKLQQEFPNRNIPTCMLYGRVMEYVDISSDELQMILLNLQ